MILLSVSAFSQTSKSIQLNTGLLIPMSSTEGIAASVQYNHPLNNTFEFYIYTGFSFWDKRNLSILEEFSEIQKQTRFNAYSEDNHIIVPVFLGAKSNIYHGNKTTTFILFEAGYSYLNYNTYKIDKNVNEETGEVLSYETNRNSKEEVTENLFGIGAGLGLSYELNDSFNIIITYKIISQLNSDYYDFLSNSATYSSFNLGFGFSL